MKEITQEEREKGIREHHQKQRELMKLSIYATKFNVVAGLVHIITNISIMVVLLTIFNKIN